MSIHDKDKWQWIEKELQGVIDELTAIAHILLAEESEADREPYPAELLTAAERYHAILMQIKAAANAEIKKSAR